MKANQAQYPVALMCGLLGVSKSGYYVWYHREPSKRAVEDARLQGLIQKIHTRSRGTYGAPRIHAELVDMGIKIGRKRVARLMRKLGIQGLSRRKRTTTTKRKENNLEIPDLLDRDFGAQGPDELWVADITYVPTRKGFVYLGAVVDAFSRRVVGWCMEPHLKKELVIEALNMAMAQRSAKGVVHHSDHGSQYTSLEFGKRCKEAGIALSMGSVGDCYDNAMAESFFATLEWELLARRKKFKDLKEAKRAVFEYIEGWYNLHRRHSGIEYCSPINYEKKYWKRTQGLKR